VDVDVAGRAEGGVAGRAGRGGAGRGGAWRGVVVIVMMTGAGCVDRLVSDEVDRSSLILPAGSEVPDAEDDHEVAARIAAAKGFSGDVAYELSGFWDGKPVVFWDFGAASPLPIPLYLLVRESSSGFFEGRGGKKYDPLPEHPPIFDKITGDAGYSPWWAVVLVPVTADYADEVVPSFAAVQEALRLGLVEEPIPLQLAINCPVVERDDQLARGGVLEPTNRAYWRGQTVYYFSFDTITFSGASVPISSSYRIRREGGEPLSEAVRGVDMNGDGDAHDSNDVFADGPGDAGYSGMVAQVDVVVRADTRSIDSADEGVDITSIGDLFRQQAGEWVPDPTHVIAVYPEAMTLNRPMAAPAEVEP